MYRQGLGYTSNNRIDPVYEEGCNERWEHNQRLLGLVTVTLWFCCFLRGDVDAAVEGFAEISSEPPRRGADRVWLVLDIFTTACNMP
jgi:hypothetical protein